MDRKSSWIRVALVLIVAALVANPLVEAEVTMPISALYKYVPAEVYSTEKVNDLIGYSIPDGIGVINSKPRTYENHKVYPSYTPRLVDILAWAKDKDKPNTIVGKFSINQLLDWNNYHPEDCSKDGLVEHRKTCDQVDPKQIGLPEDDDRRNLVETDYYHPYLGDFEPLEYMRYHNLHKYCSATLEHFEKMCTQERFSSTKASVKIDGKALNKFIGDVEKYIEANEVRDRHDEKQVVQKVLAQVAPVEAEQVKATCADLVGKLGPFYEKDQTIHAFGLQPGTDKYYYEFCKKLVN